MAGAVRVRTIVSDHEEHEGHEDILFVTFVLFVVRKPYAMKSTMKPMYSQEWFTTFAATVPASIIANELDGIARMLPRNQYPRLLDVGCGIGRISGPLHTRGYAVTGLDVNVDALRTASRQASGPRYIALDQRHVDRLRWTFDGALVLWNSLGFVGRAPISRRSAAWPPSCGRAVRSSSICTIRSGCAGTSGRAPSTSAVRWWGGG
jgi:SAM-dependent methyltransferase